MKTHTACSAIATMLLLSLLTAKYGSCAADVYVR